MKHEREVYHYMHELGVSHELHSGRYIYGYPVHMQGAGPGGIGPLAGDSLYINFRDCFLPI